MSFKPTLTIETLRQRPEYQALKPKMQIFVEELIRTDDAVTAANTAYDCKNRRTAQIVSIQLRNRSDVIECLNVWLDKDEKELFLDRVRGLGRNKKPDEYRVRLLELEARIMGWDLSDRKISALAKEKAVTLHLRREENIRAGLRLGQAKVQARLKAKEPKPPPERKSDEWGLKEMEAEQDANPGNGVAGG